MAISIQAGTLLIAVATLIGAAVGAVIPKALRERAEKRHLRIALKAEIDRMDFHNWDADYIAETNPKISPRTIFKANAAKIGMLSDDEAVAIIQLYTEAEDFEGWVQSTARGDGGVDHSSIRESQDYFRARRSEALEALESRL